MPQSGFTPIQIYYSTTSGNTPLAADLANGELAINTNDGILYYKDSSGVVQVLASGSSVSVSAALVATTANITLSGAQTIDAVAVVAGDRVLVKDQTLGQNNGIYIASASAWTRAIDANSSAEIAGRIISVRSGSANGGEQFATTFKSTDTLGTTAMSWFQVALQNTAVTFTDLTTNGNMVFGNADTDTITQAASYVTGTQLKSAKVATNTLSLAAYDVDGVAYTNLNTLTASNTPTLALTSTGVGTINNISIGATTASTGAFTTLSATGNITLGDADTDTITQAASYVTGTVLRSAKVATNTLALAAYDVDGAAYTNLITLTASNTPTLALTSTGVGTINNMSIGATTTSTGAFTTLSSTGNTTLGDASADTVTVNGTTTFTAKPTVQLTSAATNTVTQAIRLDSQSSGTPANGIGVGMEFAAETSAGNTEVGATIEAITTDVTSTSEDFDLVIKLMIAGAAAAEVARFKSTGLSLVTGDTYQINGVDVLSATTLGTTVVSSSLTSVGTIATGTWQGTVIGATYGGTGVNNGTRTLTINTNAGTIAFSGASTTMTFPSTSQTLAGLALAQTFTAAQTFRAASAVRSEAAATQDAIVLAGRAGGTGSFAVTLTPTTLTASRTITLPDGDVTLPTGTYAVLGTAQTFTAAQTFQAANAIRSEVAATQDAVVLSGRAGGTSSFAVTMIPTTLTANRTITLPDGDLTLSTGTYAVLGTAQTFTAAQTFRAASAVRSEAAATQDAIVLAGRAGGTGSFAVSLTPTTLTANRTLTLPDVTDTVVVLSLAQTFTAAQTFRAANAVRSEAAATQDAIVLAGRAGGTGSFAATITTATLAASVTHTLPAITGTLATLANTTQSFTGATTISGTTTLSSTVTMSGTTTNIDIGTSQTSGTLILGGTAQTGAITLGRSTVNQTTNIQAGATASGNTKTINIGTGGLAGSTTSISIGSTAGTSTTTVNGNFAAGTINSTRINPRVSSAASAASITPDVSAFDMYALTAQAATLTINAPTGTPLDGNKLIFRILDNGTARTLTWNATYTAIGALIPTVTTASKILYVGCIYNAANTRWDVISVTVQA